MSKDNGGQYGDIEHLGIELWGHPVSRIASDLYAYLGKPNIDTLKKIIKDWLKPVATEEAKDDVWLVKLPSGSSLVANGARGWDLHTA